MSNHRLMLSECLSVFAFALALLNDLGLTPYVGVSPGTTGILALLSALAAFFVAMRTGSLLVSGSLVAQGIADVSSAFLAGAAIGAVFGAIPLVLGLAKASMTRRPRMTSRALSTGRVAMSKMALALLAVALVAVAALGAYYVAAPSGGASSSSSVVSQSYSGPPAVRISIYDGAASSGDPPGYTPDSVTLVIGVNNTVTWTNNDSIHHTVTSTSAPSGGVFDSGNMSPGAAYTHTFTVPGTYRYDCAYHAWMTGTMIVEASP